MAPRAPASAGWIGVSTEASTTSAMMMVMLSGPPQLHQPIGGLRRSALRQRLRDRLAGHGVGQAVGAQQVPVALADLAVLQRRLHRAAGQGLEDQRPLRMHRRLLGRQRPLVDQRLHVRVVAGDLRQLTVAQQVAARISHVAQADALAVEKQGRERGAHALRDGIGLDLLRDGGIALRARDGQRIEQIRPRLVVVELGDPGDHQLRGDLAGRMAAHAVGQGQQAGARIRGVLVVLPDQAAVRNGDVIERIIHGCNLKVVRPMRISMPGWSFSGCSTRWPFKNVPLRESRSSRYQSPSRGIRRA